MKKLISVILAIIVVLAFSAFALASGEDTGTANQGNATVDSSAENQETDIGDYSVVIDSCRMAQDYSGKDVVIIKYIFTNNNDDDPTSFMFAFDDSVFQNGVGLNEAYVLKDSANYSPDNQLKEIKKGASIDVEVAYELNDTTTDVEVEVKELISFNDKTITKTFTLQ